jgi:peptide-methionine (S)-S-oxide reductase
VVRTRVGYAGGRKQSPTYHSLGDHTETVQVDFDPAQTSYEELLEVFWATHNPCAQAGVRQYMSAVFYHNDAQKKLALETRDREAAKRGTRIATEVLPATAFYVAEDYHQKYLLRGKASLMREFQAMYPDPKDFRNSTAAARVNGYLGGHGSEEMIRKEIDQLGLSSESRKALLRLIVRRKE